MKVRIEQLVGALRRAEIAVSIAEVIDAAQAVAMVGIDRRALREALAATLVKDERDRGVFLAAFDATFPARVRDVTSERRRPRARGARAAAGEGGGSGTGDGAAASAGSRATAGASAARTARVSSDEPPPRGRVRAPNRPPRATHGTSVAIRRRASQRARVRTTPETRVAATG